MRVKKRLFWYFGGHLRRAVAAMTAQPEQLRQQTTSTGLACWEGPYRGACTCTHTTWIPTVVRVNIYRPRSSSTLQEREEKNSRCVRELVLERRGNGGEWFSLPDQGSWREVGEGHLWRSVWWRGVRGKGRRAIVLRQQISKVARSQCQVFEWAGRRCTVDTESKIATCTSTSCHLKTQTWTHTHCTHARCISALRCPLALSPLEGTRYFIDSWVTSFCQLRRIDRGRNTVTQTAREGAVITRPTGMTSDPQTQAVWPEVGWEWQQVTFPFSLLTSSCSDSWNSVKAVFLMPQTRTLLNYLIAPTGMLDVILPRCYRCVHPSSLCIYQVIFSRGLVGQSE